MKKQALSLIMSFAIVILLTACGLNDGFGISEDTSNMNIAMITDSGDIMDKGFNQLAYESCKAWSDINDIPFAYYKPESDTDEARDESVEQAVSAGANVIVLPGYMFAETIVTQPELYPDVKFIALDVSEDSICQVGASKWYGSNPNIYKVTDYYHEQNVYCCTFHEEISGYMAGYAAVKCGYRHLGFLGGAYSSAVTRFGYGYLQGIDAAATELGVAKDVEVEYVYGGQFWGDDDITDVMDTWYGDKKVEVVFACGGAIYTSAAEAASKTGGKVIGVDCDQQYVIDSEYGRGMTVTSAMKGISEAVDNILTGIRDGKWSEYAGRIENLGMVSDNPEENYVQLPIKSTQWSSTFAEDDYRQLVKSIYNGEIQVSDDISAMPDTTVKVNDYGSIK